MSIPNLLCQPALKVYEGREQTSLSYFGPFSSRIAVGFPGSLLLHGDLCQHKTRLPEI